MGSPKPKPKKKKEEPVEDDKSPEQARNAGGFFGVSNNTVLGEDSSGRGRLLS